MIEIVLGNGIVVCGDTWQETKLMFDTFLQLFEISIELRKMAPNTKETPFATARASKVNGVKPAARKDDEISVVHETKKRPVVPKTTFPTKAQTPKQGLVIKPARLSSDQRPRITEDSHKSEALKRKKLALARLRDRTASSVRSEERPSRGGVRMNAASFLNNDQSMFNRMNNSMDNMNSNMNQPMMSMNNMGNMNMNSMMMNNAMLNMMNNMQQQGGGMFMNDMGGMSGHGGGMDLDMRQSGDDYEDRRREARPLRRGSSSSIRGRPTRGVARKSFKGSVKTRLGFKSTITVDPTLLNAGNVNEEDY